MRSSVVKCLEAHRSLTVKPVVVAEDGWHG